MRPTHFVPVRLSLEDLLGRAYCEAVCAARAACSGEAPASLRRLARARVDCFPAALQRRLRDLLPRSGARVSRPLLNTAPGATTAAFAAATRTAMAPLTGYGYFRIGEDGRQYFILKSEHYHAPLGHAFPGYRLLETARRLGIPNATHNNTRGFITRRLEEELVRAANGVAPGAWARRRPAVLAAHAAALNRVLNLETGSLAVEAALKLVLARFYAPQIPAPIPPPYAGRVPVLLVVGNDDGELPANYHGTTLLAQMMRGMWPDLFARLRGRRAFEVRAVRPNRLEDVRRAVSRWDRPPFKIAGFFHEIVMMNYGARRLSPAFLRAAYALCRSRDIPCVVDEIQSCMWHPELFLFRELGLRPAMVAVGKGFPGGEYPASRLLFQARYDALPQFGALVTNGQEELAALAYLITMRWAAANAAQTRAVGDRYVAGLERLAKQFPNLIAGIEGRRHLAGIVFRGLDPARAAVRRMAAAGLDISVQTYKSDCPPVALTKLPLIADAAVADWVCARLAAALAGRA